ncbi:hypothetical protein WICMUC_004123 [Wickerhamomyces mucosus]|uniref:Vps72/YL1 C-terminal domain-containing protein n=1 Tax=Wickerhamomyces mucosus TaxID=1378264 RepID=A0A9P8PK05_9ASCO|nr:hypothetical protein WICMUC_004123 [Wickerhamomyces mucosus]
MAGSSVDINKVIEENSVIPSFKNFNRKQPNRRVKPLKQITVDEQKFLKTKEDKHKPNSINYFNISSPPSIKPTKKYCDITGLKGNYQSPSNGLRYHNNEVYTIVKNIAQGVDQQYLELRNANVVLK